MIVIPKSLAEAGERETLRCEWVTSNAERTNTLPVLTALFSLATCGGEKGRCQVPLTAARRPRSE